MVGRLLTVCVVAVVCQMGDRNVQANDKKETTIDTVVASVNEKSILIWDGTGVTKLGVNDDTKVILDGKKAAIKDLKPDMEVTITHNDKFLCTVIEKKKK